MNTLKRLSTMATGNCSAIRIVLYILSACAFYATWGISLTDGTMAQMLAVRSASKPLIPGTSQPLRLHFTGIPPLDYWFTIMVLFFWEALDGSHPATSLSGIYFLGQLIGIWTLVWIEGSRAGNKGLGIARTIVWVVLMQNFTLACIGPIFFAHHLATSPTVLSNPATLQRRTMILSTGRRLRLLPFSMLLGYIIPSIILALPSPGMVPYSAQQSAIAIWTPFPVWVGLAQGALGWLDAMLISSKSLALQSTVDAKTFLRAARPVYIFALVGSAIVHIATVTLSLSTVIFPAIFASEYLTAFAPINLLLPRNEQVATIGLGVLNFMQWDQWIGYSSVLLWVTMLRRRDSKVGASVWLSWAAQAVIASALVGPGGAAVWVVWMRDERALTAEEQSMKG